jgi:hypothetical protein
MDIFNEISWPKFKELNEIRNLPVNEQINKYNRYLWELSLARDYYYQYQPKGKRLTLQNVGFLLQEDLFNLQQEDGNNIFITAYA